MRKGVLLPRVFHDLDFAPDEAQNLLLPSDLMTRIEKWGMASDLKQKDAASRPGMTQLCPVRLFPYTLE
ncbi:MAG: hypothetical protein A3H27_04425 [Acidobacteria bacterium RIFCSPLOWO2_02_FULL_59_13]|nr:MAG: hypothetical protein A3H27_04425 [Acidobacteria bacterium RIFCSPLOWO2_02_FULL_59_13]